jgi:hypothetical protein
VADIQNESVTAESVAQVTTQTYLLQADVTDSNTGAVIASFQQANGTAQNWPAVLDKLPPAWQLYFASTLWPQIAQVLAGVLTTPPA